MKIPAKIRYAVRTLCELERSQGKPVSLSSIEANQKISAKYLKQILQPLEKQGIVASRRGVKGGYLLTKPASEIRLLDVINALDESTVMAPCLDGNCTFEREEVCKSKFKWNELQHLISTFYRETYLSDFIDNDHAE